MRSPTPYREGYSKNLFACPLCARMVRAHELVNDINGVQVRDARLFCERCGKKFEAMPPRERAEFLRGRFEEHYGERQFIYALNDPHSGARRYVGRASDPQRRLTQHIQKAKQWNPERTREFIAEVRRQDQQEALKLSRRFLEQDDPNLWLCVAGSYSWRCWPSAPLPEEWQIVRDLLAFPNAWVKRSAAGIVQAFAPADMGRAVEMILETDIGEDSELASNLFAVFQERRGFNFGEITSQILGRLLGKLDRVESVRSYHLGHFLLHAALRDPVSVARFLLGRVGHKITLNKERMEKPAADARLEMMQTLDNFGGLPESGFRDDKFQAVADHPDYLDALRLLRDAALNEEYSSALIYEDTLPELFRDFSLNYSPASLEVLKEWIDSGDCNKVRAAVNLLGDSYLGFYVNNLAFVSNYLHRAQKCGKAVFEEVEGAMLHNAEYGPPRAAASLRGERSNALFHNAQKALELVQGDPLPLSFFQQLRDRGQELIQSEMLKDEEEGVFFHS